MNALCIKITDWCQKNGAVSEGDYPIVLYGIQVLLNSSLKIFGILLTGALLHRFQAVFISTAAFCSMRYWTGGWHSKSHLGCLCTMFIPCVLPSLLTVSEEGWVIWGFIIILLYTVYRVLRYAPCNSKINPITDSKLLKRKKAGSVIEMTGLLIGISICPDIQAQWLIIFPLSANAVMLTL